MVEELIYIYIYMLYLLLLTCEVTVVHFLLLDLGEEIRPCFPLDDVNGMTIYFTFLK